MSKARLGELILGLSIIPKAHIARGIDDWTSFIVKFPLLSMEIFSLTLIKESIVDKHMSVS